MDHRFHVAEHLWLCQKAEVSSAVPEGPISAVAYQNRIRLEERSVTRR